MTHSSERLDDFNLAGTISKGTFGIVYKAVRKSDGRVFALKQVKLKGMKRVDREEAIDEARMLSQLSHPYVIQHHGSFIDRDDQLNILMEYAANGSLHAKIRGGSGKPKLLPESQVWKHIIQALLGLSYIHSKKIIHRDIKSLNLFLDANDNIKIGDLGIARCLSDESEFAHTIVGTPFYLSPELCDDKPYNEKSDVWALGVVLYECCMGRYPFEAQNEGALIRKILKGTFTPISGSYSPALVQLAAQMLTFNPTRRPTTAQLLQMPSLVSQARALAIDMSCKRSQPVDPPVYEQQQQQQLDQQRSQEEQRTKQPMKQHAQQNKQQYQSSPAGNVHQQSSAMQNAAHPFEMPGAAALQYQQQPPQQAAALHQQRQQQAGVRPYPGDAAAMAELQQMMAAVGMAGGGRQQPDQLPAAGYKSGVYQSRPGSATAAAPFAVAGGNIGKLNATTSAQEAAAAVWSVKPMPPQFGRKRCTDLMATGPSLRGSGARGDGYAAAPVADDATSYCSTSYQTTSYH